MKPKRDLASLAIDANCKVQRALDAKNPDRRLLSLLAGAEEGMQARSNARKVDGAIMLWALLNFAHDMNTEVRRAVTSACKVYTATVHGSGKKKDRLTR